MERDGSGLSALVGLGGLVVRAPLLDDASGEWWLAVETTWDRAWCPEPAAFEFHRGPASRAGGISSWLKHVEATVLPSHERNDAADREPPQRLGR